MHARSDSSGMVHRRREELVLLTESAVAVALSVLLGNLRLIELPNGGSIALATLPLLALALTRGVRVGVAAGCCAGVAHALAGGTIVHPVQLGLDYFLAYAALGVAGLGLGRGTTRRAVAPWILLAMTLHLAAMVVSGVVFFGTVAGDAAVTYALAYNAATVLPESLLALLLVAPLLRSIARANPADAWRRGLLAPPVRAARQPRRYRPPTADSTATDTRLTPPHVSRPAPPLPLTPPATARSFAAFARPAPFASTSWSRSRAQGG